MSSNDTMMQTTRDALFSSIRETFIAPQLLPVCCICGLIRDETRSPSDRERWVMHGTYRQTHGVNPTEFPLTHTYCPECLVKAQDTVRTYFREIGALP
ncbi:MAG: hypothetical protein HY038_13955 [Nitrospirae bacterium]|nr:hypothetical protein [Nitrospirota bacterium]